MSPCKTTQKHDCQLLYQIQQDVFNHAMRKSCSCCWHLQETEDFTALLFEQVHFQRHHLHRLGSDHRSDYPISCDRMQPTWAELKKHWRSEKTLKTTWCLLRTSQESRRRTACKPQGLTVKSSIPSTCQTKGLQLPVVYDQHLRLQIVTGKSQQILLKIKSSTPKSSLIACIASASVWAGN